MECFLLTLPVSPLKLKREGGNVGHRLPALLEPMQGNFPAHNVFLGPQKAPSFWKGCFRLRLRRELFAFATKYPLRFAP